MLRISIPSTRDNQHIAKSSADTIVNLTNHAYFNLDGHSAWGKLDNHTIQLNANHYTPVDDNAIPTGEVKIVPETWDWPWNQIFSIALTFRLQLSKAQLLICEKASSWHKLTWLQWMEIMVTITIGHWKLTTRQTWSMSQRSAHRLLDVKCVLTQLILEFSSTLATFYG